MEQVLRFFSLRDANVQYVLFGSILLGAASGMLGTFALLRKRSLLGDALAHAALPGICIAFLLTGTKSVLPLLIGATVAGILGVLVLQGIIKGGRIKADSAIGIVLTVFFGIGIVLLTYIQQIPQGNQSGLDKFLFGQAASMLPADLMVMTIISLFILVMIVLFFKELRLLTFDPDYLRSLGYPLALLDLLLMALIVLTVMVGLQAVGVILIVAVLITPPTAARFWTNQLTGMVILASLFGALSGFFGAFFSSLAPRIPTGPVMVLAATLFFILSALCAPKRGVLAKILMQRQNQKRMALEHLLRGFIEILETQPKQYAIALQELAHHLQTSERHVAGLAKELEKERYASLRDGKIQLTILGHQRAIDIVKTHRLWEYYLIHRAKLQPDHVHRDADEIEHVLSHEMISQLEAILEKEGVDTHAIVSVHQE